MAAEQYFTLAEYRKMIRVSRSTVFDWMRKGHLREGIHYVYFGPRVLRFRSPHGLETPRRGIRPAPEPTPTRRPSRPSSGPAMNLDWKA
ncbi:MAG: hypothetical protein P1P84_24765 [Deferrisomatales bacterium]|nr:hypothetical protein [Deferrisomatales bacterium]